MKAAFEEAIALDPNFALAHCEYGLYFIIMTAAGLLSSKQAHLALRGHVQKALELDASIAEGHAMIGITLGLSDHDWKEGERRFRQAMAHHPRATVSALAP